MGAALAVLGVPAPQAALLQTTEQTGYATEPHMRELHGLFGEYFRLPPGRHFSRVPDMLESNSEVPDTSLIGDVRYGATGGPWYVAGQEFRDRFAVRWTGELQAPVAGRYELATNSDDGSLLFVHGRLVIDNDGLHGMRMRSVSMDLEAGWHAVRVEFFEGYGGAGCELLWKRPDRPQLQQFETVPSTALRPAFSGDPRFGCCESQCCQNNKVRRDSTQCGPRACGCRDGFVGARTSPSFGSECTIECVHGRWDGAHGCACEEGWFGYACSIMGDDD